MSTPDPDDHSELRDALRRDAARMPEPPFDAALHDATIRRIRALADTGGAPRTGWRLPSALAAGVALLLLAAVAIFTRREPPPARPDVAALLASTQSHIASLAIEPPAPALPAWTSPTAALLELPRTFQ